MTGFRHLPTNIRNRLIATGLSVFLAASAQAIIVIDNFDGVGDGVLLDLDALGNDSQSQTQTNVSGSLSGDRVAELTNSTAAFAASAVLQQTPLTDGVIAYADGVALGATQLTFTYDFSTPQDLSQSGANDDFDLDVVTSASFGVGSVSWSVSVTDTFNDTASTSAGNIAAGSNRLTFPAGVNMAAVDQVQLNFTTVNLAEVDFIRFDNFQAVPEPRAYAAIGAIVVFGFAVYRRCRSTS